MSPSVVLALPLPFLSLQFWLHCLDCLNISRLSTCRRSAIAHPAHNIWGTQPRSSVPTSCVRDSGTSTTSTPCSFHSCLSNHELRRPCSVCFQPCLPTQHHSPRYRHRPYGCHSTFRSVYPLWPTRRARSSLGSLVVHSLLFPVQPRSKIGFAWARQRSCSLEVEYEGRLNAARLAETIVRHQVKESANIHRCGHMSRDGWIPTTTRIVCRKWRFGYEPYACPLRRLLPIVSLLNIPPLTSSIKALLGIQFCRCRMVLYEHESWILPRRIARKVIDCGQFLRRNKRRGLGLPTLMQMALWTHPTVKRIAIYQRCEQRRTTSNTELEA